MGNVVFILNYDINLNRTAIIRMCFVSKYLTSKWLHCPAKCVNNIKKNTEFPRVITEQNLLDADLSCPV